MVGPMYLAPMPGTSFELWFEHALSAVLLRFPCEKCHTGITIWINNLWENPTFQPFINLSEFLAKQVPCQRETRI